MPALAIQLIRVGEETARLEEMLLKVAEIYEKESRRSVERLLAMLVPALTIGLGVISILARGASASGAQHTLGLLGAHRRSNFPYSRSPIDGRTPAA